MSLIRLIVCWVKKSCTLFDPDTDEYVQEVRATREQAERDTRRIERASRDFAQTMRVPPVWRPDRPEQRQ